MTAAVLLVLVLMGPGDKLRHAAYPMPSAAACEVAVAMFLRPEPKQFPLPPEPTEFRSAACVTFPAQGRDA